MIYVKIPTPSAVTSGGTVPRLLEYQGKKLLKGVGVPVPKGRLSVTPREAFEVAEELATRVMVKAQVGITGRVEAGGIKSADGSEDVKKAAEELFSKTIKGLKVEKVLVEERLEIKDELYASVVVNDSWKVKGPVVIFSTEGGTGIEEIAKQFPDKMVSSKVDILSGLVVNDAMKIVATLDVPTELVGPLGKMVHGLYQVFTKYGARTVEVNPIVVTKDGKIYAADCHIVIDEASVFKHPELDLDYPRDIGRAPTELERLAWEMEEKDYRGIGYFAQMTQVFGLGEGVVGFHGIGGGGAMLGADALMRHGLRLANYADTSGNPTASKVYRIIKLIFSQPNIDGYILMGACIANQEQWHHAHALVRALREELPTRPNFPVIILIAGNKEADSLEILREGLRDTPAKVEIYGRDYVYNVDYVAQRMKRLVEEYRKR